MESPGGSVTSMSLSAGVVVATVGVVVVLKNDMAAKCSLGLNVGSGSFVVQRGPVFPLGVQSEAVRYGGLA